MMMKWTISYIFNTLSGFNTESIQSTLKQYICSEIGATEPQINQIDILIQNDDWSCGYRIMVCINKLVTEQLFPYPQLLSFDDQTDVKSELENIFILDEWNIWSNWILLFSIFTHYVFINTNQ